MRIAIMVSTMVLSACSAGTSETPIPANETDAPGTTYGIAVSRPNICDIMSPEEIIETINEDSGEPLNQTWTTVFEAPRERFGDLADITGKCYKGTPADSSSEQVADIQHWSLALGGAAIKIEHAFEDGSYGGVSYVYPQTESDDFTYVYITNAGFHTQGIITLNDDQSFTASETVAGHPTITEVRSVSRFDEKGLVSMSSEFLDSGEWKPGPMFTHEVTTEPFPRLRSPSLADQD